MKWVLVQEMQQKLKPFIRRQVETGENTKKQREIGIDLEREFLKEVQVPGRLITNIGFFNTIATINHYYKFKYFLDRIRKYSGIFFCQIITDKFL